MYSLPYGKSTIQVPDIWDGLATVVVPGPFPATDPAGVVGRALDRPLGGVSLEDLCRPGVRVACVVPDLTRRAAVSDYLPLVLDRVSRCGVDREDVVIVVGLGIHRALEQSELSRLVGPEIAEGYTLVNHDAHDEQSLVRIGTTEAGIPVEINRLVAEADCVVLTGAVTYHYFAGYGGGRKSLLPGVASSRSCESHHKMVVSWRRGELQGQIAPGILAGNPAHRQMVQACSFAPPLFVLNVITEPDGGIIAAFAGELEAAHEEACRTYDTWYRRPLAGPSRLVVASAGGLPKDVNFVQAHKGLFSAHQAADAGGVVILAAECGEGAGHADFLSWFDRCSSEKVWLDELQTHYQINGQTAFSTWLRVSRTPTVLVSTMSPPEVERMGMIPARDMEEALQAARAILGELPAPVIIPDAGDILPVVGSV